MSFVHVSVSACLLSTVDSWADSISIIGHKDGGSLSIASVSATLEQLFRAVHLSLPFALPRLLLLLQPLVWEGSPAQLLQTTRGLVPSKASFVWCSKNYYLLLRPFDVWHIWKETHAYLLNCPWRLVYSQAGEHRQHPELKTKFHLSVSLPELVMNDM